MKNRDGPMPLITDNRLWENNDKSDAHNRLWEIDDEKGVLMTDCDR